MGYTTDFTGFFSIENPLTPSQVAYIQAFNKTRRMSRSEGDAELLPDELRKAVGLPIGHNGGYYVGSNLDGNFGQTRDTSILDYNQPPEGQPGLWCQWTVSDDGTQLEWDGGEKFYNYIEWLQYLVTHFFSVWGVKLNGEIKWQGEDMDDRGKIIACDGIITSMQLE